MRNCLFFAIAMYRRRGVTAKRKGIVIERYIKFRKSHSGWFPHFLYEEIRNNRITVVSYKPKQPINRACPPPSFEGLVRWGDRKGV